MRRSRVNVSASLKHYVVVLRSRVALKTRRSSVSPSYNKIK